MTCEQCEGWMNEACVRKQDATENARLFWGERDRRQAAEKQRDELLAALEAAEVLFACRCNDATAANWLDNARAAIASVKGDLKCPPCS
jgi:hypothetical protein